MDSATIIRIVAGVLFVIVLYVFGPAPPDARELTRIVRWSSTAPTTSNAAAAGRFYNCANRGIRRELAPRIPWLRTKWKRM